MKNDIPLEHLEQVTFVTWFERNYPGTLIFSIPNGGFRQKTVAVKLQLEGLKAGIPDLQVPAWKLFIEMKRRKNGRVSQEQKDIMAELERVGYTCIVGYGWEDAQKKVLQFLESSGRMNELTQQHGANHAKSSPDNHGQ